MKKLLLLLCALSMMACTSKEPPKAHNPERIFHDFKVEVKNLNQDVVTLHVQNLQKNWFAFAIRSSGQGKEPTELPVGELVIMGKDTATISMNPESHLYLFQLKEERDGMRFKDGGGLIPNRYFGIYG